MYPKIFVSVLFSILFAVAAVAAPNPEPQVAELSSLISQGTSFFGGIASSAEGVITTVKSVGGDAFTIITSEGGKAITLATSGAGVVTSEFGSIYTVATGAIPTSTSSAFVSHAGVQTSLLVALGSVLVSALLGMMMTL